MAVASDTPVVDKSTTALIAAPTSRSALPLFGGAAGVVSLVVTPSSSTVIVVSSLSAGSPSVSLCALTTGRMVSLFRASTSK